MSLRCSVVTHEVGMKSDAITFVRVRGVVFFLQLCFRQ